MPTGVYERKPKPNGAAPKRLGRPPKNANGAGFDELLAKLRVEREKAVDRATALGTAIDALEAL